MTWRDDVPALVEALLPHDIMVTVGHGRLGNLPWIVNARAAVVKGPKGGAEAEFWCDKGDGPENERYVFREMSRDAVMHALDAMAEGRIGDAIAMLALARHLWTHEPGHDATEGDLVVTRPPMDDPRPMPEPPA